LAGSLNHLRGLPQFLHIVIDISALLFIIMN
jgi:hypothetical protein